MTNQKSGFYNMDLGNGMRVPMRIPNDTINGDGFYVSYNDHDIDIYGSDTTALVIGQMEHFYILNGNHMEAYRALLAEGFNVCADYFEANSDQINERSERDPERLPVLGMR